MRAAKFYFVDLNGFGMKPFCTAGRTGYFATAAVRYPKPIATAARALSYEFLPVQEKSEPSFLERLFRA
jgi:hypothetical protein